MALAIQWRARALPTRSKPSVSYRGTPHYEHGLTPLAPPMTSLLHISDLHRTSGPRLRNDELLPAMLSDATRWAQEGIPWPDIVVISGDLINGAGLTTPNADSEIAEQYAEADNLLRQLADEFVASDRSRVIIVPGNHDVHWSRAKKAMQPLPDSPEGIARIAMEADSGIRWSWEEQRAYQVVDAQMYESRYEHFRRFRDDFYAGLQNSPVSESNSDVIFADYPALGLAIAGFASWHGNDCYCHVGQINAGSLALSRQLLESSRSPIAVAVWHHSVVGGPRAHDYMDQSIVHRLVDFGFSVGLHGHQHYPGASPFELRLPNLTSMVVVGAGSLAVGDNELPMGEHRQFNVVEIDSANNLVTVHVRAMSPAGVFMGSHRNDFGGHTYIQLSLPVSPARPKKPSQVKLLDEAMSSIAEEEYSVALGIAEELGSFSPFEVRQIKIQALAGLHNQEDLIALLTPPQSAEEAFRLFPLLLEKHQFTEAQ